VRKLKDPRDGRKFWRVVIGKRAIPEYKGCRQKNFGSEDSVRAWLNEVLPLYGMREFGLTIDQVNDARAAIRILRHEYVFHGHLGYEQGVITLEQMAREYMDRYRGNALGKGLKAAVDKYVAFKLRCGADEEYVREQRYTLDMLVASINNYAWPRSTDEAELEHLTPDAIDAFLRSNSPEKKEEGQEEDPTDKKWSIGTLLNKWRDIRMFTKYVALHAKQPNVANDPCFEWISIRREKAKRIPPAPEIYTPEECNRLLKAAVEHPELGLHPFLIGSLFQGFRVCESLRLYWSDFDFEEKTISIRQMVGKRMQMRELKMEDAFWDWMLVYKGNKTGLWVDMDERTWRTRVAQLHAHTATDDLPAVPHRDNAYRHTFASMAYKLWGDADKVRNALGHKTPAVIFQHYAQLVKMKAAKEFWALRPAA